MSEPQERRYLTVDDLRAWGRRNGHAGKSLATLMKHRAAAGSYWLFRADDRVFYVYQSCNKQGFTTMLYKAGTPSNRELWGRLHAQGGEVRA
jgi:hypothetical protein